MRKILSFLMLFCVYTGIAGADVPFKTSSAPTNGQWADGTTWYFIQFPNSDTYHTGGYLAGHGSGFISSNNYTADNVSNGYLLITQTQKPVKYSALWCIVGDEASGFKFYNRMNPYLVLGMDANNKARFYKNDENKEGVTYAFEYAASTNTKTGLENCATFRVKGTNKYWNNYDGGGGSDYLSVWDNENAQADNGSAIRLTEVTAEELTQMEPTMPAVGKFYNIKNARTGKYASYNGDAAQLNQVVTNVSDNEIWYFEVDEDGYKLCNNATSSKYASTSSFTETGVRVYVKENPYLAGCVCISTSSDLAENCWDDASNQTKIGTWNPKVTDYEGTSWILEEVVPVSVTFNYYEGETLLTSANIEIDKGATIEVSAIPAIDYFNNYTFKTEGDHIAAEGASFDINCTANFPFTPMTITDGQFASDDFYTLTINNQGVRPVVYVGEGASPVHTKVGTQALTKGNLWAFKRVSGYTVELYNLAVGATSPLKAKSVNDAAVTFNTSDESYTSQFIIKKNGANFVLYCSNGDNRDLNACKNIDGPNNGLGVWSPDNNQHNDAGSTFIIGSVEQSLQDLVTDVLLPELELDDNYSTDDYVYSSSMATPEAITTAAENYNTTPNGSTLAALLDAMEANADFEPGYTINISADKFYQLISYNDVNCQGKAIYSISGCGKEGGADNFFERELYIETAVGQRPVAETAFQFVADGDGYDIIHANSNYHFSKLTAFKDLANPNLPISKQATIVIENQRGKSNVWSFRCSDNTEKYLHCGTGNDRAIVRQQSPADNDGNLWLIKEIKNVPVTIGAAKWATLCLPMAVTVPEDATLKVFYVTGVDAEDNLTLEEVAAGTTLAKKQPVLLYSTSTNESDVYQFAVSTAAGTTLEGNILSGSTARRGDFSTETSEYYALANKTEGVGFYPSLSAKIAANKAYILTTALQQNTKALYLNMGDATGIEQVNAEKQATIYYDLNGRRVFYPSNGVFITNTGKKVFIK